MTLLYTDPLFLKHDTGPHHPETHWAQTYLPFPPRVVRKGARVRFGFELARDLEERRHVRLTIRWGKKSQRYLLE